MINVHVDGHPLYIFLVEAPIIVIYRKSGSITIIILSALLVLRYPRMV